MADLPPLVPLTRQVLRRQSLAPTWHQSLLGDLITRSRQLGSVTLRRCWALWQSIRFFRASTVARHGSSVKKMLQPLMFRLFKKTSARSFHREHLAIISVIFITANAVDEIQRKNEEFIAEDFSQLHLALFSVSLLVSCMPLKLHWLLLFGLVDTQPLTMSVEDSHFLLATL